ncbi:hypothetical protein AVEN_85596-1 [Araneus ventricosus]|uniref:Uncharacterized protein n=1 Tax=Araneus ventricosus TaxID=182803 RepID=A0A4Y2LGM2_ARAVE|nr:hypothetical protein AVEN_85596-1 [Araneus ventricosus]
MECLNYNPLPLKEMALRKVASVLWMQQDILIALKSFPQKFFFTDGKVPEIGGETAEEKTYYKISKLLLPESLKKRLIDTTKHMGIKLRTWRVFHKIYLNFYEDEIDIDEHVLEKVSWTTTGEVHYLKTSEELLSSNTIDIGTGYKLASLYCLEEHVRLSWAELPEVTRRRFYLGFRMNLQYWWPYFINQEDSHLASLATPYGGDMLRFNQFAFEFSTKKGNKAALSFFQKLTSEEKEVSLISATGQIFLYQENVIELYHEYFNDS